MPTFLTTPKMAPELAARVVASVHGRRPPGSYKPARARAAVHLVTLVRFGVPLSIVAMVVTVVHFVREDRRELERARASLIADVAAESASLTPDDRGRVAAVDRWLLRLAGAYEGDVVADELHAPALLDAALAHSSLYVRGPLASFNSAAGVADAASSSSKDSFVRCLADPPASRAEKVVLAKVLTARAVDGLGARVFRLDDAEAILPLLQPAWAAGVRLAPDVESVTRQRRQVDKAPVERGVAAMKGALLVVAMDEPSHGGTTELDGEAPHDVRVAVVDLTGSKVLLRMRKHVDPTWVSVAKRPMYAAALDSCILAMDVRDALAPSPPPPAHAAK
jgi:hypothetical protein